MARQAAVVRMEALRAERPPERQPERQPEQQEESSTGFVKPEQSKRVTDRRMLEASFF